MRSFLPPQVRPGPLSPGQACELTECLRYLCGQVNVSVSGGLELLEGHGVHLRLNPLATGDWILSQGWTYTAVDVNFTGGTLTWDGLTLDVLTGWTVNVPAGVTVLYTGGGILDLTGLATVDLTGVSVTGLTVEAGPPTTTDAYYKIALIQPGADGPGTLTQVGFATGTGTVSGTPAAQTNVRGAYFALASAATTNSDAGHTFGTNHVHLDQLPVLTWQLEFPSGTDFGSGNSSRVWVGVTSNPSTLKGQDTLNSLSGLAFRLSSGTSDTKWQVARNDGGATAPAVIDSGVTVAASTRYVLQIDCSDKANIIFRVNGTVVATVTTSLPATGTRMAEVVNNRTLANATKNLYLGEFRQDYVN